MQYNTPPEASIVLLFTMLCYLQLSEGSCYFLLIGHPKKSPWVMPLYTVYCGHIASLKAGKSLGDTAKQELLLLPHSDLSRWAFFSLKKKSTKFFCCIIGTVEWVAHFLGSAKQALISGLAQH